MIPQKQLHGLNVATHPSRTDRVTPRCLNKHSKLLSVLEKNTKSPLVSPDSNKITSGPSEVLTSSPGSKGLDESSRQSLFSE